MFVHRKPYEMVVKELSDRAKALKVGPGMDPETEMGPLVSAKQQKTVLDYIEKGKAEGARLVAGGTKPFEKGYFVEPTVFADVEDDMTIAREEIFGPVMRSEERRVGKECADRASMGEKTAYEMAT